MSDALKISRIMNLITENGKHASYQDLPALIKENFKNELKGMAWSPNRLDGPRLDWIKNALREKSPATITDIGANTGFFSVELKQFFRASCTAYEPHEPHAEALSLIRDLCGIDKSELQIKNVGVSLGDIDQLEDADLLIFLNVLHHAGDDFDGTIVKNISDWKKYSFEYLERLSEKYNYMFFQLGNAWKGFDQKIYKDDKFFEMTIDLLQSAGWLIESAGLVEDFGGTPRYKTFIVNSTAVDCDKLREINGARKVIQIYPK